MNAENFNKSFSPVFGSVFLLHLPWLLKTLHGTNLIQGQHFIIKPLPAGGPLTLAFSCCESNS